jgi:hypothetical protein
MDLRYGVGEPLGSILLAMTDAFVFLLPYLGLPPQTNKRPPPWYCLRIVDSDLGYLFAFKMCG